MIQQRALLDTVTVGFVTIKMEVQVSGFVTAFVIFTADKTPLL
jgi:hypothetical protein